MKRNEKPYQEFNVNKPKENNSSKEKENPSEVPTIPRFHPNPFATSSSPLPLPSQASSSVMIQTHHSQQVRFYPDLNKRFKPNSHLDNSAPPLSHSLPDDPFTYSLSAVPAFQEYPPEFWQPPNPSWNSFLNSPFNPNAPNVPVSVPVSVPVPNQLHQNFPFNSVFYDSTIASRPEGNVVPPVITVSLPESSEDSIAHIVGPYNKEESDESPPSVPDPIAFHDGIFVLRDQPKPKQRKSYKRENRYLLPNPTQLIPSLDASRKKFPESKIVSGTCKVSILDGTGNTLPKGPNHYIEDTEGPLKKEFDPIQGCFNYALKLRQNSGPEKFRLAFNIKFKTADGIIHREKVVSNAFLVQSNKSFFSKDPKLKGIHPCVGSHDKPNEVWIKGRDFNEKGVVVTVDGITANILEIQPNLIMIMTPVREEITKTKVVNVTVSNLFKKKMVSSEQHFQFTYVVPENGKINKDQAFPRSGSPLIFSKENSS